MLTKQEMVASLRALGIKEGDTVVVHSSFKSLGPVDGGAETVVAAFLEAVGAEGTVVFPTLCQKDFEHAYENWHLDAPSDIGYLTNYFRKLPDAKRSDQATHSIAAIGKDRDYLTATHGQSGLRYGIYGDTPFSADSPWEKMYLKDAKTVLVGVPTSKITFRHFAEYYYMDKALKFLESTDKYEEMKAEVWCYERFGKMGVWPHVINVNLDDRMREIGKLWQAPCGEAMLTCVSSRAFVDEIFEAFKRHDTHIINVENFSMQIIHWMEAAERLGFVFNGYEE